MSILNRRVMLNNENTVIPTAYQEVEYIVGNGNNYIDTGYYLTSNNTKYEMGVLFTQVKTSGVDSTLPRLFGREAPNWSGILYSRTANLYIGSSGNVLSAATWAVNTKYDIVMTVSGQTVTTDVNGTTKSATFSGSLANTTYPIWVMACNAYNQPWGGIPGYLYYFRITDNGNLVRDFVPCYRKSDNVVGVYDLVTKSFFYSPVGSFVAGPEV